jgi:UDP-2-acetamido-3-amino-2,3-dideoxy-glucuronate N-acetyltransferase
MSKSYQKGLIKLARGIWKTGQVCFIGENVKIGKCVKISPLVFIDDGVSIGDNTLLGVGCVIRPNVKIGQECIIGHHTVIEGGIIRDRTNIHAQCHICRGSAIDADVFIGPFFMCTNTRKINHGRGLESKIEGPYIKRGARIGANVTLLPGIVIGGNAIIGAGSVVTKNIPDKEVWFGVPAVKSEMFIPEKEIL